MAKEKDTSVEDLIKGILEQGPPEIMTKPLPQILDEMEANIRAAAAAVRKAEEAANAARGAAGAATTASVEAAKRAEEARQAGKSAAKSATQRHLTKRWQKLGRQQQKLLKLKCYNGLNQ